MTLPVTIRREVRPSGATVLHLEPPAEPVILSPEKAVRVAQISRMLESMDFPAAWYVQDQIRDLHSFAMELRTMVEWPAEDALMPVNE